MRIVRIPPSLNLNSIGTIVRLSTKPGTDMSDMRVTFDFNALKFVDPVGFVGLASFIKYLSHVGIRVFIDVTCGFTAPVKYLDDAGFFEKITGKRLDEKSYARSTTVPYFEFLETEYVTYLHSRLTPWIAAEVDMSQDTLATIRACLEELFHNVEFHSGVRGGVTVSQHYPQKNVLKFAISDSGRGIPALVRTVREYSTDSRCIREACEEGFSTKSNVLNRGAGLAILIRYVTLRNGGSVEIRSLKGLVRAWATNGVIHYRLSEQDWDYPGTLVHVSLRTDTLEKLEVDVEPEVFTW